MLGLALSLYLAIIFLIAAAGLRFKARQTLSVRVVVAVLGLAGLALASRGAFTLVDVVGQPNVSAVADYRSLGSATRSVSRMGRWGGEVRVDGAIEVRVPDGVFLLPKVHADGSRLFVLYRIGRISGSVVPVESITERQLKERRDANGFEWARRLRGSRD